MNDRTVVFLGPSLSHAEAQQILPGAICLPPAAMGDVLGASLTYRPHAIGLVDGTFLSNMSVFHKELLYAMDQGAWVLGSSSMGALRAAECSEYGMIGVGQIFDEIRTGQIEDDDEVALTHASSDEDFRPLSDAFVTIRATLNAAEKIDLLSKAEVEKLLAAQKLRWFPDRRLSAVVEDASKLGMDPIQLAGLKQFFRESLVDPKREDAIALLTRIKQLPKGPFPEEDRPVTVMSGVFVTTLARDVIVETPDKMKVTFDRIRRHAALHDPDFADDMRETKRRVVLAAVSGWLGGAPTENEVTDAKRRLLELLVVDEEDFDEWIKSADLQPSDAEQLIATDALLYRLENCWLGRSKMGEITTPYLNLLRLQGRYTTMKAAAALQQTASQGVLLEPHPNPQVLISSLLALGTWKLPTDLNRYLEEFELGSFAEFLEDVTVSVKAHHALFGVGLVDADNAITVSETQEPMMSRGR